MSELGVRCRQNKTIINFVWTLYWEVTAFTLSLTKLFVKEAVVVLPGREASVLLKPTVCLLNLRRRVREWGRWVGEWWALFVGTSLTRTKVIGSATWWINVLRKRTAGRWVWGNLNRGRTCTVQRSPDGAFSDATASYNPEPSLSAAFLFFFPAVIWKSYFN